MRFSFLKRLCAFIIGAVFLVSGLFKVMDPVGSSLVMESYFNFLHLGFLRPLSMPLSVVLNLLECFVAVALISGIWLKLTRIISAVLLGSFTVLTILLLIFNPEMDCGCFGEVIHLTHLQSFLKNVALVILWFIAFVPGLKQHKRPVYRFVISGVAYALVLSLTIYSFKHLPLLDLTSLKIGTEIEEGSLSLLDQNDQYADDILQRGRVLVVSVYKPESADYETLSLILSKARQLRIRTLVATSGQLPFELSRVYTSDRRGLMSLNRANLGVSLFSSGQIAYKWTPSEFIDSEEDQLTSLCQTDPAELIMEQTLRGRRYLEILALSLFVILLI